MRLEEIFAFAESRGDITVTSPYDEPSQVSRDGTIAFAQLDIRDSRTFTELQDVGNEIVEFGDSVAAPDELQIEYGGDMFAEFELPESEVYGLIAAVIILILAFGSVLAMGLPDRHRAVRPRHRRPRSSRCSATCISMPDFTTAMVAMIGLGVGIDYALFIVTRYRENLARRGRRSTRRSWTSIDTSGPRRAVRRHSP